MLSKLLSRSGLALLGSIIALAILLPACKKDNAGVEAPVAGLMAFNLVPDQTGVEVALSGNLLPGSPLSYTSFTGRYVNVFPGDRLVESFNRSAVRTFDSVHYTFEPNKYYSLFVVGANNTYKNIIAVDNYDSLTASSGKAYVRYINAIPDPSASTVTISANGSEIVNNSSAFQQVSSFVAVSPGDINVHVNNGSSINTNRTINVGGQRAYTILLVGLPNQADSSKAVQIRFIENGSLTD